MESYSELRWPDSTADEGGERAPLRIWREVHALEEEMVANRRWFHAHAELSFEEVETAAHVVRQLQSYGICEIYQNVGVTGVVAMIRGEGGAGPTIGLRADMDALPVQETAEVAYKSRNEGVMHACGHDGHMAELLCAARVIHETMRASMRGNIKLIFQPAEEGRGGAAAMIADGVLEDGPCGLRVDFVYGIHLWSFSKLGDVCCSNGPVMAASDKFEIAVLGKGGHGAAPQGTVDAIVEAASVVTALQTIISRNKDPLETGVVTCGTISGGYGYNVIADRVVITGTARSFSRETQELIKSRMGCICCGVAQTFGGEIDLKYEYGYPCTINAYPECVSEVTLAASEIVGSSFAALPQKTMGAEDFSYFLQQRPGCFFFVGAALPGEPRPHHKSVFDFDERAMQIGSSVLVQLVHNLLVKS